MAAGFLKKDGKKRKYEVRCRKLTLVQWLYQSFSVTRTQTVSALTRLGSMTVCLRGRVKVLGEGVRASSSSASARGNGEESKNGVAGATGMFFINSPASIREGMRADAPLDRLL